ncbi:hypothetical protein LRS05_04550 [Flavobacterium sp. J372]|uniref:hypothetical protein n=1 Tax=Flavobacterium sp. J372 TaxID=2898436 RepID=UPI002150A8A4|nr:hypothetical protein [Flavobacterium sp. J372]MCR5861462.1 hypothetical protein [Flavobacterium sp. J372]
MKKFVLIVFALLALSCSKPVIEITPTYIYNSEWSTYTVEISEVELKQNIQNPGAVSGFELFNMLQKNGDGSIIKKDSNFLFSKTGFSQNKIMFTEQNGDLIWSNRKNIKQAAKVLGRLKEDTWYVLSGIKSNWLYFAYFKSTGKHYVYSIMPTNI